MAAMNKDDELQLDMKQLKELPELMVFHQNYAWGSQARKAYHTAARLIRNQVKSKKLVLMTWPLDGPAPSIPSKNLKVYKLSTCHAATNVKINLASLLNVMLDADLSPRTQHEETHHILDSSVYKTTKKPNPKDVDELELGDHMALDDTGQKKQEWWKLKREKAVADPGTDDCGEDMSGLGEVPSTLPESAFSGFDDSFHPLDPHVQEETAHLQGLPVCFLHGSDISEHQQVYHSNLSSPMNLNQMISAFMQKQGRVDLVEVFGGAAGVTKVSMRKKLTTGGNFDLTSGVDLLDPIQVAMLMKFIRSAAPLIAIIAPPCTAFSSWQSIWKDKCPENYKRTLAVGMKLSQVALDVCNLQLSAHRHFIVENPTGSKLWHIPGWHKLIQQLWTIDIHQCSLGLTDPNGIPTLKPTRFLASHPCLLSRLTPYRCPRNHEHQRIEGSANGYSRSKWAQVWPQKLCDIIVAGICELRMRCLYYYNTPAYPMSMFPGDAAPIEAEPISPAGVCPGCRAHAVRTDSRHTRIAGQCRFPGDTSIQWACGACSRHLPSHHPQHSRQPGDCHWADAPTRLSGGRAPVERGPQPMRDGSGMAEAPPDAPDGPHPPNTTTGAKWKPVTNEEHITLLQNLHRADGWNRLPSGDVTLTITNGRWLRGPSPRWDAALFDRRSSYAIFTDYVHPMGMWWQLEDHDEYIYSNPNQSFGYSVDCLILIFHATRDGTTSASKNNPSTSSSSRANVEPAPATPPVPPRQHPEEAEEFEAGQEEVLPPPVEDHPAEGEPQARTESPDWTSYDLGRILRTLRSDNVPVIIRTLRALHLKWWHCSADKMKRLLEAAGVQVSVLDHIKSVVDTCRICRQWKRPTDRAIASTRISRKMNECVEIDLLFVMDMILLHMLDECTRFSMCKIIKDKQPDSIHEGISDWIAVWGPPQTIMSDREGALCGELSSIWAERLRINLLLRAPNQHAAMVERHHQTLRNLILKISEQCQTEGLAVPKAMIIAIAVSVKNAMISIGGMSPQEAATGVAPRILGETENPTVSELEDSTGPGRHMQRVREIAVKIMVDETARQKTKRAEASRARVTGEQLDLTTGSLVDIWRSPKTKDLSGWRGPCTVISTHHLPDGFIDVTWGGRVMAVKVSEVRRSLQYLVFYEKETDASIDYLRRYLSRMDGYETHCAVTTDKGWMLSKHAQTDNDQTVLRAILRFAHNGLHLARCIGGRLGRNITSINGLWCSAEATSLLMWWPVDHQQEYKSFLIEPGRSLNLRDIFGTVEEFQKYVWIQFLMVSEADGMQIHVDLDVDIPHMADPEPSGNPRDYPDHHSMRTPLDTIIEDEILLDDGPITEQPMPSTRQVTPYESPATTRPGTPMSTRRSDPVANIDPPNPTTPIRNRSRGRTKGRSPTFVEPTDPTNAEQRGTKREAPLTSDSVHAERLRDRNTGLEPIDPPNAPPDPPADNDDDEDDQDPDAYLDSLFSRSKAPSLPIEWCLHPELDFAEEHSARLPSSAYTASSNLLEASEDLEYEIHAGTECYFHGTPVLKNDEILVFKASFNKKFNTKKPLTGADAVIERNVDALTAEEIKANWTAILEAQRKEVASFEEHDCFEIAKRHTCSNICTSRWILRWKMKDNVKIIKARLVIRGFQDDDVELQTFASTTTRWGQRLVTSLAPLCRWKLYTLDIGTAFLRGLPYTELSEMQALPERDVAFEPPRGSEALIQELKRHRAYNPVTDVLRLLKAAYGLRDAPRAWRTRLDQFLKKIKAVQCITDSGLYMFYNNQGKLSLILSCHVDDLKIAGEEVRYQKLKSELEVEFGKLAEQSAYESELEHCGLKHRQATDFSVVVDQAHYAKQLRNIIIPTELKDSLLSTITGKLLQQYMSLLGAVAWLCLTRPDICVYVTALQRATSTATIGHVVRLNKLVRYVRHKESFLSYPSLGTGADVLNQVKLVCISDSAYRREDPSCLAMRGSLIAICLPDNSTTPGGTMHTLEYFSRRQRKITRSTFAAETMSLTDGIELSRVIAQTWTSVFTPGITGRGLIALEEKGELAISIEGVIDCRSLFDSLAATELSIPSESSLILILASIKELMNTHVLETLWWVDTFSMLADGLNKGLVSRKALLAYSRTGRWNITGEVRKHSELKFKPILDAKTFLDTYDELPAIKPVLFAI